MGKSRLIPHCKIAITSSYVNAFQICKKKKLADLSSLPCTGRDNGNKSKII
jgi:hypothetical protein